MFQISAAPPKPFQIRRLLILSVLLLLLAATSALSQDAQSPGYGSSQSPVANSNGPMWD